MNCLADVQRGENCEDVSLDRGDQQLDHADEHDEEETQDRDADPAGTVAAQRLDHEVAEDVEENVAGEHRDERTKSKAERSHEEAQQLYRRDRELEDER